MIKIGIFCPGYGRIRRGIETVVEEIFSKLHKKNNYIIDIYTGGKNVKSSFANVISIPVISYKSKAARIYSKIAKRLKLVANEPYDLDFFIFSICSFVKSLNKNYDIIFNEAGLYMQYFLNIYRMIHKTPIIHSGHAGVNSLEFSIARLNPDVYLASSPFALQQVTKRFPELDTRVLPNGVTLSDNHCTVNLKLHKPIILFVGALVQYKRADNLIKAFKKLNYGSLLIIGDGPQKNILNNLLMTYQ